MKNKFEAGEMISTTIVSIYGDTVFLDIGLKSEGFLDAAEITNEDGSFKYKEGDSIKVYFVGGKNDELHFTKRLAGQNASSDILKNAFENKIPVEGTVKAEIKGGFEVTIGTVRTFCPYSQMGYKNRKEPSEYIGTRQTFRITEYKNEGKNIIVSNRIILEEQENAEIESLSQNIQIGGTVKGTVKSIESYGAFIDLNGFQALLPISQISHARISKVEDVLKIGDEITAKVISADWKHQKVSLSTKELEDDPWDAVSKKFTPGTKIMGTVSRVTDFGVFVNIASGIDGLVHISKLNVERSTNLKKVYNIGQELSVIVEKIDPEEKRISLSLVVSNEEQDNASEYLSKQDDDDGTTYNPFAALLKK